MSEGRDTTPPGGELRCAHHNLITPPMQTVAEVPNVSPYTTVDWLMNQQDTRHMQVAGGAAGAAEGSRALWSVIRPQGSRSLREPLVQSMSKMPSKSEPPPEKANPSQVGDAKPRDLRRRFAGSPKDQ
jgi:hypothetical protein